MENYCFWSLLSFQNLDFVYLPHTLLNSLPHDPTNPVANPFLGKSFFDFIHPDEVYLARQDLAKFILAGSKKMFGSVTSCRFRNLSNIHRNINHEIKSYPSHIHLEKSSISALINSNAEQKLGNDAGENYVVVDVVMHVVSEKVVLAFFHADSSHSGCGEKAFDKTDANDVATQLREWSLNSRVDMNAIPLSPQPAILDSVPISPVRIFQISNSNTKELLFTWPESVHEKYPIDSSYRPHEFSKLTWSDSGATSDRSALRRMSWQNANAANASCGQRWDAKFTLDRQNGMIQPVEMFVVSYGVITFSCFQVLAMRQASLLTENLLKPASSSADVVMGNTSTTHSHPSTIARHPLHDHQPRYPSYGPDSPGSYGNGSYPTPRDTYRQSPPHITIPSQIRSEPRLIMEQPYSGLSPPPSTGANENSSIMVSGYRPSNGGAAAVPPQNHSYQGYEPTTRTQSPGPPHSHIDRPEGIKIPKPKRPLMLPSPLPLAYEDYRENFYMRVSPTSPSSISSQSPYSEYPRHDMRSGMSPLASSYSNHGQQYPFPHQGNSPTNPQPPSSGPNGNENIANGETKKVCKECGAEHSPEWRKGPLGHKTLCNACGLRYSRRLKSSQEQQQQQQQQQQQSSHSQTHHQRSRVSAGSSSPPDSYGSHAHIRQQSGGSPTYGRPTEPPASPLPPLNLNHRRFQPYPTSPIPASSQIPTSYLIEYPEPMVIHHHHHYHAVSPSVLVALPDMNSGPLGHQPHPPSHPGSSLMVSSHSDMDLYASLPKREPEDQRMWERR